MRKIAKKKSVRLSKDIVPERYAIKLKPDLEKFTFEGEETVTLRVIKATRTITLHSKELDIETAEIVSLNRQKSVGQGKGKIFALKITYDEKAETATFHFPAPLQRGAGKLRLVFRGVLNDKLRGFYRSQYEVAGVKRHMATTQFESTDARRAFPCFDEPAHKAVFDVTLLVPTHTVAISNTLPVSEEERDGLREVSFAPTPKMSTYLLAFIVGEFEHVETRTKEGTLVRVFVTPGKKHQAEFALECAAKTLSFYNEYFDIPYPLPVLDMIAIPDFSAGAMENWGAITYRESALLVDPKHSSSATRQWVALVIAHEIAHQWFGNLVTMEWWTHLWLNEGFASYIEYLAVDKLFSKWSIFTQFAYMDQGRALALDGLKNTHPIEVEVHHPDEIAEIFDEVSYSKGASVIKMIADYLGETDFRDGLRHYLKKHSYKNTSTIHLWQAFEKISGKPVAKIMKNWTGKSGFPVVEVSERGGKLLLSQKRFFNNPQSAKLCKDKTVWEVPLAISVGGGEPKKLLFGNSKGAISTPKGKGAISINSGAGGFFLTAYSPELLLKFIEPLQKKTLPTLDRLALIRDVFALAEGGIVPATEALILVEHYKVENNYSVWSEISHSLNHVRTLLLDTSAYEHFRQFVAGIYKKAAADIGWKPRPNEDHSQALLRSLLLSQAGLYGDSGVIATAQKLFESNKPIPADIRGVVYSMVARNGGEKEYRAILAMYRKETLQEEKNRLGHALGAFQNEKLLKETLEFSLSKGVRLQDGLSVLASVLGNSKGRSLAWEFVKKNWPTLLERYGTGGHSLSRLISATSGFTTREAYNDLKKFFKTHPAPGATRAVEQVLEKIDGNIRYLAREGKNIDIWLLKKN